MVLARILPAVGLAAALVTADAGTLSAGCAQGEAKALVTQSRRDRLMETDPFEQQEAQQRATGWIGVGISCGPCGPRSGGKTLPGWFFGNPPVVVSVDRGGPGDLAGLRTGDTLLAVDGRNLVTAEGGQAWGSLRPGVRIRLTYARGEDRRTVSVTPVESPHASVVYGGTGNYFSGAYGEAARRAAENARDNAAREAERARTEAERSLRSLQREFSGTRGKVLDETSMRRIREYLGNVGLALREPRAVVIPPVEPTPRTPMTPLTPPTPATPPLYVLPSPGRLRYSGRLGETIIEARRSGGVSVEERGDSEVVVTGGDLQVRIARERGLSPSGYLVLGGTAGLLTGTVRTSRGDVAYGLTAYPMNPRLGEALDATSGVLVLDVREASHADSLGIRPGDVLMELNGNPVDPGVRSSVTVTGRRLTRLPTDPPGAQTAVVLREGEELTLRTSPEAATPPPRARRP